MREANQVFEAGLVTVVSLFGRGNHGDAPTECAQERDILVVCTGTPVLPKAPQDVGAQFGDGAPSETPHPCGEVGVVHSLRA